MKVYGYFRVANSTQVKQSPAKQAVIIFREK